MSQMEAYVPTVQDPKFLKNPDKWLKDGFWEVDYPVVVNPLDEAIAARDVVAVQSLTGLRFPYPEGLPDSPSERTRAIRVAFDVWALTHRDELLDGWRSKASG